MNGSRNQRGNKKVFWTEWKLNSTYQNVWDVAKVVSRGKFKALNMYIRREEKSQI